MLIKAGQGNRPLLSVLERAEIGKKIYKRGQWGPELVGIKVGPKDRDLLLKYTKANCPSIKDGYITVGGSSRKLEDAPENYFYVYGTNQHNSVDISVYDKAYALAR